MSGLLFLTSDDFNTQKGTKGNIVCNNIRGFSLILFYSTSCPHCQQFIPLFKTLPGNLPGCQFGLININKNKRVIRESKQSVSPIEYVPYIILFINGKPFMRYDGPPDQHEIINFIQEISKREEDKQQFSRKVPNKKEAIPDKIVVKSQKNIPQYSVGVPLYGCDGDVCYFEFQTAYKK